jgi:hypothetical protein
MTYYYRLDSDGEDTNLQLHAFQHAKDLWHDLQEEYKKSGEHTDKLKEKCVLVLATLGLSISQLLGQNNPAVEKKDVPPPIKLFNGFVDAHGLDAGLKTRFRRFNYFYNGCRHFGKTTDDERYQRIDDLTFSVTRDCYEFGLEVWRTVIEVYRGEGGVNLDDFEEEYGC